MPAEGTRRIESVHGGRIDARTLARLEGPTTWEFPLDLLFEALLKMPNAWVERVRLDALPKPEGSEEGDARRLADSLRRLDKLIHEGARSTR
ncbi:MAG: hypothetical protein H6833_12730 [Planctomycetes bacterium]|nr:hypothetical protein [Planctomycetota bacterium]